MNLAARRSARQRENFVMRLGCLLVSFAVVASLVFYPPKAKAFVATSSAVSALAGGFLNACGLAPVVSGMSSSGEVNESIARLIQEYLDSISVTADEWLGRNLALTVTGGKLYLPKPLAQKLGQFAVWVASKYAAKPGVNPVYSTDGLYPFHSEFVCSFFNQKVNVILDYPSSFTVVPFYSGFEISSRYSFDAVFTLERGVYEFRCFPPNEITENLNCAAFTSYSNCSMPVHWEELGSRWWRIDASGISSESFTLNFTFCLGIPKQTLSSALTLPIDPTKCWLKRLDQEESSFGLDVSDTMQQVLERLTALEEGQSIALDVGATQTMEIQEILQGILDAILAGNLDATAEIVDTAEVPVDPPAEELPDVDGLGLPALGAALTSRFPFSIPWDVYKGVTLLAAPPKAPYFEVDFMAPIADRVGGWQGSTTIVLDFSEYEIIGQVCRWTSTIGFCLMLATGTKRLIWTA